jgi:hypothetical protein
MRAVQTFAVLTVLVGSWVAAPWARAEEAFETPALAVGPQYETSHVYVSPEDVERFSTSLVATFGGTKSQQAVLTVTPTPSETIWQAVFTPVGSFSVFGFKTPIPYPFGLERTGYLVTDFDSAVRSAKAHNANIVVAPFNDPIGRDVIIEWPGGVYMQLYWHTKAPNSAALEAVPENRVYVSPERVDTFVRGFVAFSRGKVVSDNMHAPGIEIGRPNDVYRRVRIESAFGNVAVLVTDGHLPYPYGREMAGYEVTNLSTTLTKAKAAGATVLLEPYDAEKRRAAIVQFPGGYIAELHSSGGE